MYLSRLYLNPRSRQVRGEMANPYEMHRTIMSAFPADLAPDERVLFRLEIEPRSGQIVLLVQSRTSPNWSSLSGAGKDYLLLEYLDTHDLENPATKQVDLAGKLAIGKRLAFRLRANPTVKKKAEGKENGRRVGLYREEEQLEWLRRKLREAGCELLAARTSREVMLSGVLHRQAEQHQLEFLAVQFDGVLQVTNPDLLVKTVEAGIGSGKGLGFGLLSLAPAA